MSEPTTFPNKWFSVNKNHSLENQDEVAIPHLFFDTVPDFNASERTVNLIVTTPEESPYAYQLDLKSGQRYFSHQYCKQKDIWNNYSSAITRPSFSIGYMPRTLDQLGTPQKVIVWSKSRNARRPVGVSYDRVRIFGAFVEQVCAEGNCLGRNNWISRLVFMAIDEEDPKSGNVNSVASFKEEYDWEKAKAHLSNIDGRNFIGDKMYASIRVSEPIEFPEAYEHFKKHSVNFTPEEMMKVQKNCHLLYERLWENVGRVRPEDLPAKDRVEADAKDYLREDFKKKKIPFGFSARLKAFTKRYFNEVTTCEKFIYHGNINANPEKFWFLSYMATFYRLHREGYFFDCNSKTWSRNTMNVQGERVYNIKRDIDGCKDLDFDQAMNYLPNFLNGLKGDQEYYRFIDYDNHTFGSHQKMYSWAKMETQRFDCGTDPNIEIRKNLKVFPEDVTWKTRSYKDEDYDQKMKIIR